MVDRTENKEVIHVLLKGDTHDSEYVEEFREKNLRAFSIPVLNFEYQKLDELATGLLESSRTDADEQINGLIITSPRVVEALARALASIDVERRCDILKRFHPDLIFVIGQKTGQECVTKLGLGYNEHSANTGNSQNLLNFIKDFRSTHADKPFCHLIYPKGSRSDNSIVDGLSGVAGTRVIPMVVYRTLPSSDIRTSITREVKQLGLTESKDMVINLIFFSPSGVEVLLQFDEDQLCEEIRCHFAFKKVEVKYSSIGMTTKEALSRIDRRVSCVSDKPNPSSLVKSILACSFE